MPASGFCAARRRVLGGALAALVPGVAFAHTPYRQWSVYRRKHLLVGASRDDPGSYESAQRLAALLARQLPRSKARVARAPTRERLASLVSTGQLLIVLLKETDAVQLRAGGAPYADYGPFDLRLLGHADDHLLLASPLLPAHHAWLVSSVLAGQGLAPERNANGVAVPLHPGAAAFAAGDLIPAPGADPAAPAPGDPPHE